MRRAWRPLGVLALLGAGAAAVWPAAATGVGAATGSARVAVWGPAVNQGTENFTNTTIRHIVYPSIGGVSPRVRVSNLRGTGALTIGAVDLARQQLGGSAQPATHHPVTFAGASSVTLAAGQEMTSDPVDMTVPAGANLLISVYVANQPGTATWHPASLTTTYVSQPGNHAADDSSAAYPEPRYSSWYFLSGLDLVSSTATGTLVAFGDSITDGYASSFNTNRRYCDYLARRLVAQPGGPSLSVINAGIAGNSLLTGGGNQTGHSGLTRFGHDALGQPGVTRVIVLEGINDITSNPTLTAAQLTDGYQQLIAAAHAAGVRVYGGTLLPYGGSAQYTPGGETIRQAVNAWTRGSGAFDGVIDFDAALRDPQDPTRMQDQYAHTDHLHPNDAGHQAMADAVHLDQLT
jgi:lysophospholipase L1-like esterase